MRAVARAAEPESRRCDPATFDPFRYRLMGSRLGLQGRGRTEASLTRNTSVERTTDVGYGSPGGFEHPTLEAV